MLAKSPSSVQNANILAQKKDVELHIIESLHNHDPGHQVIINKIIIKITLDPAMLATAHTLLKIVMNQYVIDASQILTIIQQPNVLGKYPTIDSKNQTPLIIIIALEINLIVRMTQMWNFCFHQ